MNKESLYYYLVRISTFPLSLLPYTAIHFLGKILGTLGYYFLQDYRKTALSNLALASDLHLTNQQIRKICKESFQNLAINVLEYPRFARETDFSRIIQCRNPKTALNIYEKKQGIIFFCGHLSNWETLFLDGNVRMRGIAMGKPTKNKKLYQWIVRIREKNGGKIILPKNALKESLRALKKGVFVGIVGDQGMPDSSYSFPFLGRRAWTTTAPALLAYKTNSPIIVATTKREKGKYWITYSDPIWPRLDMPMEKEIVHLMDQSLLLLQDAIKKAPGQWLWQHNRWKQQTPKEIYKPYRKDAICIILPEEKKTFTSLQQHLFTLKKIYNNCFIFLMVPKKFQGSDLISADETTYYHQASDLFTDDYRFKLVLNFTPYKSIKRHFLKKSAFAVLSIDDLKKIATSHGKTTPDTDLSTIFTLALCRNKCK